MHMSFMFTEALKKEITVKCSGGQRKTADRLVWV